MVDYSRPTMIYLEDEPSKMGERFRACFCPSRELSQSHNVHHGHLPNMYLGDKLGRQNLFFLNELLCLLMLCKSYVENIENYWNFYHVVI